MNIAWLFVITAMCFISNLCSHTNIECRQIKLKELYILLSFIILLSYIFWTLFNCWMSYRMYQLFFSIVTLYYKYDNVKLGQMNCLTYYFICIFWTRNPNIIYFFNSPLSSKSIPHNIAEILLRLALNNNQSMQVYIRVIKSS